MSRLADLKSATSRADVAKLLQTTLKGLTSILYSQPISSRYRTFEIPKRSGGTRVIKAPDDKLKLLQQKLSTLLQDCLDEINAKKRDTIAHGFKRKRSIITNAKQHRNRRWVFNIDLEDFFPSIHFGRVRGFFLRNRDFGLQPAVATTLSQIACDGTALPQGAPCSPVISNLVAHVLDMHIVRLAAAVGCTYSRYADDLTFSTNKKDFPPDIAVSSETEPHLWMPGDKLQEIITHCNFKLNPTKTRMQYTDSRQCVTGLVVNRKINVRREYRHKVRAMVHNLFSTGSFQIYAPVTKDGKTTIEQREGKLDELHGRLSFVDGVDLYNRNIGDQVHPTHLSTKESMYRHFLIYRDFYTAETPVILCEGKTDNVYLKHAIRRLATSFPDLADLDQQGKVRLKVRIYKYAKSSTARILGLNDGGTSHISKFIANYKKDTDKFNAPGLNNPIIILFDNDSGANAICSAAQQARPGKKPVNRTDPFTHVVKNLYVVPTPPIGAKKETKIENFFDAATIGTIVVGKSFNASNNFDETKYYGKWIFTEAVITPNADTIDFSGFSPLLTNISMVIQEHVKKVPGAPNLPAESKALPRSRSSTIGVSPVPDTAWCLSP
jgi:RNA-directed DNA polymerase